VNDKLLLLSFGIFHLALGRSSRRSYLLGACTFFGQRHTYPPKEKRGTSVYGLSVARSARVLRDGMRFCCAVLREWCISDGIAIHVVHKTAYRPCPRYRTVSTQKSKVARAPFDVRFRANLAGTKFKSSLHVNIRRSIDVQSRSRGSLWSGHFAVMFRLCRMQVLKVHSLANSAMNRRYFHKSIYGRSSRQFFDNIDAKRAHR